VRLVLQIGTIQLRYRIDFKDASLTGPEKRIRANQCAGERIVVIRITPLRLLVDNHTRSELRCAVDVEIYEIASTRWRSAVLGGHGRVGPWPSTERGEVVCNRADAVSRNRLDSLASNDRNAVDILLIMRVRAGERFPRVVDAKILSESDDGV